MRPLNLIPPEDRRGDSAPLRAGVLSYAVVGFLAVALIAVVALVLTSNKINESKSELASLEARAAAAQQASAGLAPYDQFASLTENRDSDGDEPRPEPLRLGSRPPGACPRDPVGRDPREPERCGHQ